VNGVGAADRLGRGLAQPDVAHLALLDQFGHRAHGLLYLDVRVHPVLVVEVDVVGAEPLERALDRAADMLGRAVDITDRRHISQRGLIHAPGELRSDHVLVAVSLDRPPDQLLVRERSVQLRRVQEVDPELERPLDGRDRLALIGRSVESRHAHTSESEL